MFCTKVMNIMDITTLFTSKKTILFPIQKMMGNFRLPSALFCYYRITTRFSIGNSGDLAQNCNFPDYLFSIQLFINKKQMIMKKFYLLLGSMLMVSAWPVLAQQSICASDQEPTDAWPTDAWPVASQQSLNASDQEPADAWPWIWRTASLTTTAQPLHNPLRVGSDQLRAHAHSARKSLLC